jgi:hypothetical protein
MSAATRDSAASILEKFTTLTSLSAINLPVLNGAKLCHLTHLDLATPMQHEDETTSSSRKVYRVGIERVCNNDTLNWLWEFHKSLTKVVLPITMGKLWREFAATFCAMLLIEEIVLPVKYYSADNTNSDRDNNWREEFISQVRQVHPNIVISTHFTG